MVPMFTATRKKQIASRIRARREELGLRQDTIQEHGGPSPETVNQYEQGNIPDRAQDRTLHGYDRALRWQTGSIRRFLETGEEPTPLDLPIARVTQAPAKTGVVSLPRQTVETLILSASKLGLLARVSDCQDESLLACISEVQNQASDLRLFMFGIESQDPEIISVITRITGD